MKSNIRLYILGTGLITTGVLMFYAFFWKLAPYIASTIPAGPWQGFLKIITYALVGYFGGIALPISVIALGIYAIIIEITNR